MAPPRPPPPPLSAPGLVGPISFLNQPVAGPRSARRSRNRLLSHARLEIDLAPEAAGTAQLSPLGRLQAMLGERMVRETADIRLLAVEALHALAARRFRRVESWAVAPNTRGPSFGGAVPRDEEVPVGSLLKALESDVGGSLGKARTFSARLSDRSGNRIDLVVRRAHRERSHALSLDLQGSWTKAEINSLKGALAERLPVVRSTLPRFQYA